MLLVEDREGRMKGKRKKKVGRRKSFAKFLAQFFWANLGDIEHLSVCSCALDIATNLITTRVKQWKGDLFVVSPTFDQTRCGYSLLRVCASCWTTKIALWHKGFVSSFSVEEPIQRKPFHPCGEQSCPTRAIIIKIGILFMCWVISAYLEFRS